MDTPITRAEHEEFCRRMESENKRLKDEDDRQNHRIGKLEEIFNQFIVISSRIDRLAANIENMLKEQESIRKEQQNLGNRMAELENWDGKSWRDLKSKIIDTFIKVLGGAAIGALAAMIFK